MQNKTENKLKHHVVVFTPHRLLATTVTSLNHDVITIVMLSHYKRALTKLYATAAGENAIQAEQEVNIYEEIFAGQGSVGEWE